MGEQVDKGSGEHDTRAELLQDDEDDVRLGDDVEARCQDWQEHAKRAGRQNDEKKSDAQRDIVVTRCCIAGDLFATAYAVSAKLLVAYITICERMTHSTPAWK